MAASVPLEQRTQVTVFSAQAYDITFFNSELERLYAPFPEVPLSSPLLKGGQLPAF
jgi:hypothetical protein